MPLESTWSFFKCTFSLSIVLCTTTITSCIYLKHFKGCQQFTSFIGASVDLKPFQARSFIIFLTKEYIRLAYGPSQEFSFADLKSEKKKKKMLKKRLAILSYISLSQTHKSYFLSWLMFQQYFYIKQ